MQGVFEDFVDGLWILEASAAKIARSSAIGRHPSMDSEQADANMAVANSRRKALAHSNKEM